MKHFLRAMLALCGVNLVLCGAAITIGHTPRQAEFLPHLRPCGAGWCLYAIQPGVTALQQAQTRLDAAPDLVPDWFPGEWSSRGSDRPFHLSLEGGVQVIDSISLAFRPSQRSVADVITTFGPPCLVLDGTPYLELDYPSVAFVVGADGLSLQPRSPVGSMTLLAPTQSACQVRSEFNTPTYPWRGFRDYSALRATRLP